MSNYEVELRKYIESALELKKPYYIEKAREWAFGAVDFAYGAGLITWEILSKLQEEYGLLD